MNNFFIGALVNNFFIGALFGVIIVLALWITDLIATNAALWRENMQLRARIAKLEAQPDYLEGAND